MKTKKVLFTATSNGHLRLFHLPYIKWFKEQGYIVHVAVNCKRGEPIDIVDKTFCLPMPRTIILKDIISSFKKMREIINKNNYDLITTHTPIPSFITRLAAIKSRKRGTKLIYTAHGFHFHKGSSLFSWLVFYPIEAILSYLSDAIITINTEDYNRALSGLFSKKNVYKINGIGFNTERLDLSLQSRKIQLRQSYNIPDSAFVLIYIAEFTKNKNHKFLIDAIPLLKKSIPNIKVLFLGKGKYMDEMIQYTSKQNIDDYVHFMGFRQDIDGIIAMSDLGITVSKREGLPINVLEILHMGLPIVASSNRGHQDIISDYEIGYIFRQNDQKDFTDKVVSLYKDEELRKKLGRNAHFRSLDFTIENSLKEMINIYNEVLCQK